MTLAMVGASPLAPSTHASAQEKPARTIAPRSLATNSASPTLAVPSAEALLLLVRTTMIAIDQADRTGNYSVLRAMGGPGLQAYSVAQLAKIFEALRLNKIDLAAAAVVTPELVEQPAISSEGLLSLKGFFHTRPMQIHFRFVYQADRGQWKPFGLSVSMMPATATADSSPPGQPRRARTSP